MIKVAINGYGRIGKVAHRVILERFAQDIEVAAINAGSSTDLQGWLYLLKFDTSYKTLMNHTFGIKTPEEKPLHTESNANFLGWFVIDGKEIPVFSEKDFEKYPWGKLDIDVVIESTGVLVKEDQINVHTKAGAKAAILSAPFKGEGNSPTYVLGVNLTEENAHEASNISSNASCTTNCIAPVAQVMQSVFGVKKAMMSTIHGYTSDQRLQDGGHKDYRRARAAAQNIVPTSTGATIAAGIAIPELKGIFTGLAFRVPVAVGSLSDFTFLVKKKTTVEEVNKALEDASHQERYKNILSTTYEPLVSSDIIGSHFSSVVDLSLTQVVDGDMVKVVAWYDNEYGYSNRLVEQALLLGRQARIRQQHQ